MGNCTGEEINSSPLMIEMSSKYQKRGTIEDPRFGKVGLYNHKFNSLKQVLFKEKWTNNTAESA